MKEPQDYGRAADLAGGLRCILAPNPSAMTGAGTNTYLIGHGEVALIDPGPADEAHLGAILAGLGPGERITHILVTHSHADHSALSGRLASLTGATVLAFGDSLSGRRPENAALAGLGGGEGVDHGFAPDATLADGQRIEGRGWQITARWTPGHFGNHMCFEWQDSMFTGDLVMGWASSMVSPPDGDLGDYMQSLAKLAAIRSRRYYSGHGAPIDAPLARVAWLRDHRRSREQQILAALADGPMGAARITDRVYRDTPASLHAAARRTVLAHLVDLARTGLVRCDGPLRAEAVFGLAPPGPGA